MKRSWTIASASAYMTKHKNDSCKGLTYWSAYDFLYGRKKS